MADISIVTDNCLEESDEALANKQTSPNGLRFPPQQSRWRSDQLAPSYPAGVYEQGDGNFVGESGDEALTPLQRIEKATNFGNRKNVCRILLELFKMASVEALTNDLPSIMDIFVNMAQNCDRMVKTDVLEHIPILATMAKSCSSRVPALENVTSEYLLPIIVRHLGTSDNQLRQTTHAALFHLMEKGLVNKTQAEIQVCPTVLALSRKNYILSLYHSGAVTLMSKMVPLLGKDVTERVFLDRFVELCSNETFYVRKMCASHMGEFCATVGKPAFEKVLLPAFVELCEDEIWGVRKACADVAVLVSCVCSPSIRKTVLTPAFAKLLKDDSRWVMTSAYHMLGPFISTFAEPTITSMGYNDGELVLIDANGREFKVNCSTTFLTGEVKNNSYMLLLNAMDADEYPNLIGPSDEPSDSVFDKNGGLILNPVLPYEDDDGGMDADGLPLYNSYNYWYVPPDMPLDPSIVDAGRLAEMSLNNSANEQVVICPPEPCNTINEEIEIKHLPIDSNKLTENKSNTNSLNELSDKKENIHSLSTDVNIKAENSSNLLGEQSVNNENEIQNSKIGTNKIPSEISFKMECDTNTETSSGDLLNGQNSINDKTVKKELLPPSDETKIEKEGSPILSDDSNKTFSLNDTYTFEPVKKEVKEVKDKTPPPQQLIVPQELVDYFIKMADICSEDHTIAFHCAYSFTAVALTLGRDNWYMLKDTLEKLAANMHYQIRRSIAYSLHRFAVILGPEMATENLTPIFTNLLKDLDEVRIGVIKYLTQFLEMIIPAKRSFYSQRLLYFLKNHQEMNWRYRYRLVQQIIPTVTLFTPNDASKHISVIALRLLCDKVALVRQITIKLVMELLKHIGNEPGLTNPLLVRIAEMFAHSKTWKLRQTFVIICAEILKIDALPLDQFSSEVQEHLLDLSWDPVPNVRLMVAEIIVKYMITNEHFSTVPKILENLRRLQTDKDRDVRLAAQGPLELPTTFSDSLMDDDPTL